MKTLLLACMDHSKRKNLLVIFLFSLLSHISALRSRAPNQPQGPRNALVQAKLLGSLSSDVFEPRTSTGSEVFSLLTCLDDIKFARNHRQKIKKGHFRLTYVAQKRCCLSSLLQAPVPYMLALLKPNNTGVYWSFIL